MIRLGSVVKDAWNLARPFFTSEEKWSAWVLLLSTVALNLLLVGMGVVLNFWNGAFFDALQARNLHQWINLLLWGTPLPGFAFGFMPGFTPIAVAYVAVAVYANYINQWLYIRWRRWMTERMTSDWLARHAYYHISLIAKADGTGTENPDQRIANDIDSFVSTTMSLLLDLISNVVTLASYFAILWTLSGAITLWHVRIPGYLIWVALLYSAAGSVITKWIGAPLVGLNFMQQRFEANFRFHLARMRDNTEAVALYRGEAAEHKSLTREFADIVRNWHQIMSRTKLLNSFTSGFNTIAGVFPAIVVGPRFIAGKILLGTLTRTTDAFSQVQGAMSWFVSAFSTLASWAATIERLATFQRAIDAVHNGPAGFDRGTGPVPALDRVAVRLPDGTSLLEDASMACVAGRNVAIRGRSGSGKSTLFRAMAGIWPFGRGLITIPTGTSLFLPQRPYFPIGSLRQALAYPSEADKFSDRELTEVLHDVGLGPLAGALDEIATWSQRLSGGEQQRLAIARALLMKPEWLFLDEATSALDPQSDAALQALLASRLPRTTRIAISHDPTSADQQLKLERGKLVVQGGASDFVPVGVLHGG